MVWRLASPSYETWTACKYHQKWSEQSISYSIATNKESCKKGEKIRQALSAWKKNLLGTNVILRIANNIKKKQKQEMRKREWKSYKIREREKKERERQKQRGSRVKIAGAMNF